MKKLSEIEITEEIKEKASKCATAEELTALAQEYGVELTPEEISGALKESCLKELTDEDLDLVAGGDSGDNKITQYLPPDHGPRIGKYEAEHYIKQIVYCVNDEDPSQYFWGELKDTFEYGYEHFWGDRSYRVHDFWVWDHNRNFSSVTIKCVDGDILVGSGHILHNVLGDKCTLFKMKP